MVAAINVLFVDDSLAFLETFTELCGVFSHQAWHIERASSVDRALVILGDKPVELVVLDLGLPMMDGSKLIGLIQQRLPGIKIAVMTGDATDFKRADALASGADLFVEKPVTPAGISLVFHQLKDLVMAAPQQPARNPPSPSDSAGEGFVVLASYDGKWNPPAKD